MPVCFIPASTRAGLNGVLRIRTPVASKIAFPIAAGIAWDDGSPMPPFGTAGAVRPG
jgi:hypothetical protein